MKTIVVVNPNSSNGQTGREWGDIRAALERTVGPFDDSFTERSGDATGIVRRHSANDRPKLEMSQSA